MLSIYLFTPKNAPLTKKAIIKGLLLLQLIPISILIITFLISLLKPKYGYHTNVLEAMIVMGFIFFSITLVIFPMLNRIPQKIEIFRNSKTLKVIFLNGFGTEKEDIIDIENSKISYAPNPKKPKLGKHLKISQDIFKKWISISQSHGFTEEQLLDMYNKILELKA